MVRNGHGQAGRYSTGRRSNERALPGHDISSPVTLSGHGFPQAWSRGCWAWAASGPPQACSGASPVFMPRSWAMREAPKSMRITPGVQRAHRPCGSREAALASPARLANALERAGHGGIRTAIREGPPLYYAEDYRQQYLAKNPNGYCGIGGCGVPFKLAELPVGEKA